NDIENKRKNLTMKTLENITKKMGVSLCEFLCDTEAKRGIRLFEVHLADEVVELEADSINYHDDHITLYDKDRNLVAYFNKTFVVTNWMGRTFWGKDNSKLATNETIFSVITRISNTVSILPLKLHKDYEIAHNQSSDVLINEPNQNMNGYDFINKMEVSRNETGNAYAVIFRDIRMRVEQIIPIDPDYVTPFINTDTD